MKRIFLLLVISPLFSLCQEKSDSDSLIKYSYHLVGINPTNMNVTEGTCFFQKLDEKYRLVTAKHVILNCNYNGNQTDDPSYETITLFYNNDKGFDSDIIFTESKALDIKHVIKTCKCLPNYEYPDTVSLFVKNTYPIYSIEQLIINNPQTKKGKIVIYGFSGKDAGLKNSLYNTKLISKIESSKYLIDSNFSIIDKNNNLKKDTINYSLFLDDYKINGLGGFSGSPIFIQDEESKKWYFLGLLTSIEERRNVIFFVKQKYLFNQ